MQALMLCQSDIKRVLSVVGRDTVMDRLINDLHEQFAAVGRGEIEEPPSRTGFARTGDVPGVVELMPHRDPGAAVTVKIISYSPDNFGRFGLPTITGTIFRVDDSNGRLVALADGSVFTAMRTGAVAAVASRLLSPPQSRVLGLIGAGAQAVTQAHALSRVFPLDRILASDVDAGNAKSLARRIGFLGLPVEVVAPESIVSSADIISTVTSVAVGAGPVLPYGAHQPYLHINAMGADEHGKTELPKLLLDNAYICVDHVGQARQEGEFQQLPNREIGPSLAALCATPGLAREKAPELTVLDSTGSAFADHISFSVLLGFADELGLGQKVDIECTLEDVLNPYSLL